MSTTTVNGKAIEGLGDDARALLQARARRLQIRLTTKADEPTLMVAQFRIAERQFAMPLAELRAAMPLKLVTPVPLSPPQVVGILRYQGQVITVFSLATLVGIKGWRKDPTVLLVVEPAAGKFVAFDCEEVPKPTALSMRAIEKARQGREGQTIELFAAGSDPIQLLDVRALSVRGRSMGHEH